MNALRVLAVALIAAGVLGLVYHHFNYNSDTHAAKVGSLELSVSKTQSVDVPTWLGIGAVVAGAALLVFGGSKR